MKKDQHMGLQELFIQKINALYDMELQLVKALPKLAKASTNPELKKGFHGHLEETKKHVTRLEEIHKILGIKPKQLAGEGIRGIIADGEWVIKNVKPAEARDANIARAAQYAEHYEMAGYLAAIDWAKALKQPKIVALLKHTLSEEMKGDRDLAAFGRKLDKKIVQGGHQNFGKKK